MYMADHPPSPHKNLLFLLSSTEVKLIMISTFEHLIQPSQCNLQPRLKMVKRLVFFFIIRNTSMGERIQALKM